MATEVVVVIPHNADRDGVARYELGALGYERRNDYAWLGYWPRDLLKREYPAWKRKAADRQSREQAGKAGRR